MSYDIYGNPLRRGHCEVHPHVHEEYPCSVCMTESRRRQEEQSPAQCNGNPDHCESAHYLGRAQEEITRLNDEIQALRKDAERLDWLEQQTKQSPTGSSFDYVRYIESGRVLEQGYRFMRRHFMGERRPTIREAINAAMEQKHEP